MFSDVDNNLYFNFFIMILVWMLRSFAPIFKKSLFKATYWSAFSCWNFRYGFYNLKPTSLPKCADTNGLL